MLKNFFIYESELRAMAYEASKYPDCETGGDLYGLWTADGCPVVFLATGPGKNAVHRDAQYQMDIEYEQQCEDILIQQFGIHYLGDWHSHHRLNIYEPSAGDRQRIQKIFYRNNHITHMAEIIVNHAAGSYKQEIVSAYIYDKSMNGSNIKCLELKTSPIREKLKRGTQKKLFNLIDGTFPFNKIILGTAEEPKTAFYESPKQLLQPYEKKSIKVKLER